MVWPYDEYCEFLFESLWEKSWKVHVVLGMIRYGENFVRETGEQELIRE